MIKLTTSIWLPSGHYRPNLFQFSGLGCIEDWATTNNHQLSSSKFYESTYFPELDEIDWLIVMGGPMGIYDYENYPYLKGEKSFIKQAIEARKTIIGICLGAQLIADVLGAKVSMNPEKEIVWFDIQKSNFSHKIVADLKEKFTVFHWLGDTFEIPENAEQMFYSAACQNQAFTYNDKVIGLQFHLEVTEKSLNEMIQNGNHELQKAKFVQSAQEIRVNNTYIKQNNRLMFDLLNKLNRSNITTVHP